MRRHRVALRRIALIAAGTALAVLTLLLLPPMDQSALGVTFCYPFLGPVQRFNPDVTAAQLSRIQAHEAAHAAQCRRDGSVWHVLRRLAPSQRLQSESEASCAEVRFAATEGAPARLEYARVLD